MGKLTLLLVTAAVLGGSMLTLQTQRTATGSAIERAEGQYGVLARDVATGGHGLVLNAMMGNDGFRSSPGFSEQELAGGRFTVDDYTTSPDGQTVSFTVTGHSGGAAHTIRSVYEWDPMDFPGPLWIDVPYVVSQMDPGATIDGGRNALPTYFDRRLHDQLRLESLVPLSTMRDNLRAQLSATTGVGGDLRVQNMAPLLDDLNVNDARDLYYAALGAMNASDVTIAGPSVVASSQNHGTDVIAHYEGDLTVTSSGRISGAGLLIVEGGFVVEPDGEVDWDGIILVHSEQQEMPVHLDGRVRVDGAMILSQIALPPGGHLDVTVMRDLDGSWSSPRGDRAGSPWTTWGDFPWYQHKHRFDLDLPEERTVYFAEDGRDRHEEWTQFRDALATLGTRNVYLEFINSSQHGYARWTLDVDGDLHEGTVKNGFGSFSGGSATRSLPFRASDLNTFIVDVRSLRMLRQRFDGVGGCDQWPFCVGEQWGRGSALTVRLRDASNNRRYYEGTLYWHMQAGEVAEHLAEEAAWRARIEAGEAFGTNLRFGREVQLQYDLDEIEAIGQRLGFDGDEMIVRGMWMDHSEASISSGPMAPGSGGVAPPTPTLLCHRTGPSQATLSLIDPALISIHQLHGDRLGACDDDDGDDDG